MARGPGKRIDTIAVRVDGGAATYKANIYMEKDGNVLFHAHCDALEIKLSDRDMDTLLSRITKAIKEKASIKWEPWLEIEVEHFENTEETTSSIRFGGNPFRTDVVLGKTLLEVTVTEWFFAEVNGKKVHRSRNSLHVTDGWIQSRARDVSNVQHGRNEGRTIASITVIRDTPEARAALEQIKHGITLATEKIAALLAPETIEKSFARILAGGDVLSLPSPGNKK